MKVAILGNIAGVAQEIVQGLRRAGVDVDLYMTQREFDVARIDLNDLGLLGARIRVLDPPGGIAGIPGRLGGFLRKTLIALSLLRYDVIHSHTGSLCWSEIPYRLYVRWRLRPYLAFATGSDFREMARFDPGRDGRYMRSFFAGAREILLLNCDMMLFKDEMGFHGARFFPFVINEEKFAPPARPAVTGDRLKLFMMSNLDFGFTDGRPGRNSMKANDNVFRALAMFIAAGGRAHLTHLDRGPDRHMAKQLIDELGLIDHVTARPELSEDERIRHLADADVVLDQFHVGAFGLGALEALSMGRPVITYVQSGAFISCYGSRPEPFMNAKDPRQICEALLRLQDPKLRSDLSSRARSFVLECHSRQAVIPRLIELYLNACGMQGGKPGSVPAEPDIRPTVRDSSSSR